jgi:hypothetical protein
MKRNCLVLLSMLLMLFLCSFASAQISYKRIEIDLDSSNIPSGAMYCTVDVELSIWEDGNPSNSFNRTVSNVAFANFSSISELFGIVLNGNNWHGAAMIYPTDLGEGENYVEYRMSSATWDSDECWNGLDTMGLDLVPDVVEVE